jgi:hypothetical protein
VCSLRTGCPGSPWVAARSTPCPSGLQVFFHVTSENKLLSIFQKGLCPGRLLGSTRRDVHFSPFPPWDRRNVIAKRPVRQIDGRKAVICFDWCVVRDNLNTWVCGDGCIVCPDVVPMKYASAIFVLQDGVEDWKPVWCRHLAPLNPVRSVPSSSRAVASDDFVVSLFCDLHPSVKPSELNVTDPSLRKGMVVTICESGRLTGCRARRLRG